MKGEEKRNRVGRKWQRGTGKKRMEQDNRRAWKLIMNVHVKASCTGDEIIYSWPNC